MCRGVLGGGGGGVDLGFEGCRKPALGVWYVPSA